MSPIVPSGNVAVRRLWVIAALCLSAGTGGCVMFEVGVTNPVAGLTTVAVAPFFNLSEEPTVDGRRFAQAYYAELQKTPGFEVLPVGVVEQAIHDHRLELGSADDALKLAEILHVDAVVIGAVTDYSPYYPPRIGMAVRWYSPYQWEFIPGIPLHDEARQWATPGRNRLQSRKRTCEPGSDCQPGPTPVFRGQSAEFADTAQSSLWTRLTSWTGSTEALEPWPAPSGSVPPGGAVPFDPRQPLMAYIRLFDGSDPKLTSRLRDYRELSGDLRSGGWEAYLHRSDDFIRFTSHVMVVEMLQLHGGEAKRRVVVKLRRQL